MKECRDRRGDAKNGTDKKFCVGAILQFLCQLTKEIFYRHRKKEFGRKKIEYFPFGILVRVSIVNPRTSKKRVWKEKNRIFSLWDFGKGFYSKS